MTKHPSTEPAIEFSALTRCFGDRPVLDGIDLQVAEGEMFALLGPNGAGKSTLFSILCTLRAPTRGKVLVHGHDTVVARDWVRRHLGIVFQDPALAQLLTVRENLELMGRLYGLSRRDLAARTDDILERLQLVDMSRARVQTLSGGQRRRLELARALMPDPRLLCLDEATLGLDLDARRRFWATVAGLVQTGRTVFFATHYMQEAEVAHRIALINAGKIVAVGTPAELKARVGSGVIGLHTDNDPAARRWLTDRGFAVQAGTTGLVITASDPAATVPILLRELPARVERVDMREPSLEDVFFHLTGRSLASTRPSAATTPGDA